MPLVGIDWSQTGVTHLFSAVKVCVNIYRNESSVWDKKSKRFIFFALTGKRISAHVFKCTRDFSGLSHKTVSS